MKEFILIFRHTNPNPAPPSPEQMQARMNWLGGIAAQNKLANKGNRLSLTEAKAVQSNGLVTDGPYTEIKEFISGYMIVKTETIEDAVAIAQGNPDLKNVTIEVRAVLEPVNKP